MATGCGGGRGDKPAALEPPPAAGLVARKRARLTVVLAPGAAAAARASGSGTAAASGSGPGFAEVGGATAVAAAAAAAASGGGGGQDAAPEEEEGSTADRVASPLAAGGEGERHHPLLHGCRRVERFKKLNRIDEGTYGVVYRARDAETGEVVALKQLKILAAKSEDGFPIASLREISILLGLNHPNVVRCREVVMGSSSQHIFMVMEYIEHELKVLIDRHRFSIAEVKCLVRQLLDGVRYLHEHWVVHRDLKPTNILLNNGGVLKVCDFGLARHYGDPLRPYTQRVQSLWYRAPELLLGLRRYTPSVDIWSLGCVFAEILLRKPCFEGRVELHQLGLIFELTGVPTEETWPGCERLPNWRVVEFKLSLPRWRILFPEEGSLSEAGLELLQALLECCPERRASAAVAHKHPYFWETPYPQEASMMPTFQESNCEGRRAICGAGPRGGAAKGAAAAAALGVVASAGGGLGGIAGAGLRGASTRGGPPPFVKLRVSESL